MSERPVAPKRASANGSPSAPVPASANGRPRPPMRGGFGGPWGGAGMPAEKPMMPRWRSASVSTLSLFNTPRTLNEPVFCRFSHLSETRRAPIITAIVAEV